MTSPSPETAELRQLDKLIFEHSPDDIDTRLRLIISYARAEVKEPKDRYVQMIKKVFAKQDAQSRSRIRAEVLEARIDEAGGVQLVYGHYMAQTHAGGKWQKMSDRREDLQDELATLREQPQEGV